MPGPTRLEHVIELLHAHDRAAALTGLCQQVVPGLTLPSDALVALVWATPDIERSAGQVVAPFVAAGRDQLLGAQAWCVRFGRLSILLEQPDRRSGLEAYVSRYGDGVAAIYVDRPDLQPPTSAGRRPARPLDTPLGRRGWLLPHEWPWGPFVVTLEPGERR